MQKAEVHKVERVVHNAVDLVVEVPRPVVIEKTIEAALYLSVFPWDQTEGATEVFSLNCVGRLPVAETTNMATCCAFVRFLRFTLKRGPSRYQRPRPAGAESDPLQKNFGIRTLQSIHTIIKICCTYKSQNLRQIFD